MDELCTGIYYCSVVLFHRNSHHGTPPGWTHQKFKSHYASSNRLEPVASMPISLTFRLFRIFIFMWERETFYYYYFFCMLWMYCEIDNKKSWILNLDTYVILLYRGRVSDSPGIGTTRARLVVLQGCDLSLCWGHVGGASIVTHALMLIRGPGL